MSVGTLAITGAASFIGNALREHCQEHGVSYHGIDLVDAPGVARADIRDPGVADLIPEGSTIVHLAAISRDVDCRTDPSLASDVNITGSINIARAAKARKASQLIFASSEWVYGEVASGEVQHEDQAVDLTRMKSEYAISKLVGEQYLRLFDSSVPVTVLRFGIVYGPRPGNWSAVEALFDAVRTKEEVRVGSLRTARRFIHVDDIVSGILAARGRRVFEIFNLSGDRPVALDEVIRASAAQLGRNPVVIETNPTNISVRNPDNTKARAELAWRPKVDLKAGISSLAGYFSRGGQL